MKRTLKKIFKWILYVIIAIVIAFGLRIVLGLLIQAEPETEYMDSRTRNRALKLHHDSILFDGHNDVAMPILFFGFDLGMDGDKPDGIDNWWLWTDAAAYKYAPFRPSGDNIRTHTDLARIKEGGLDAQFFAIWTDCAHYRSGVPGRCKQMALDMIDAFQNQADKYSDSIEMAYSVEDVLRIVSQNKLAALLGIEGGHAIENDLANLREFYKLGVRYMTLTHFCSHDWADSEWDSPKWNGLSDFGVEVVKEMNRLGMIVDVSHTSDETFRDVVRVSEAPIMASHSNARAIANTPRNLTDEMLRAAAKNGGIVMVNFMTPMVDPAKSPHWKTFTPWHWFWHPRHPETPISTLIDHIDHIVKTAGVDHVGLGSDFDGIMLSPYWLPEGIKDVGDFPNITAELVRRGYSDEDIQKILGGNMLRVFREVEKIAAKLSK